MADDGVHQKTAAGGLDLDLEAAVLDKNRIIRGNKQTPARNLNSHAAKFGRFQPKADGNSFELAPFLPFVFSFFHQTSRGA